MILLHKHTPNQDHRDEYLFEKAECLRFDFPEFLTTGWKEMVFLLTQGLHTFLPEKIGKETFIT